METKLKYFIYCRKSSDDEDRQILSIPAQLRELNDYARSNNINIIHIFSESKSAFKPGRDEFNKMMEGFNSGVANALLVWHINRIARNSKDGGDFIWKMDESKIKQVDTPSKQYYNTPDDKFYMNLEFSMAKKSSDDLSLVVKRGIKEKYERGEYPNFAPIGYINTKVNGHPNIAPDPVRSPLLIKTFTEYATGNNSLGQMAKTLRLWGLKTRKDKPISKSHLHRILLNPIYYGWYHHG